MSKNILSKQRPEKKLLLSFRKRGGRGSSGRVTIRHRGGGVKKLYRVIDFGQTKMGVSAKVISLEYDPYRTAFLMLLEYGDKERRYEIAPHGLKVGDEIICSETAEIKPGNRLQLKNIPIGTMVYNIELEAGQGGKLVRGAGTAARVMGQEGNFTHLSMPSGEIRKFSQRCFASIGQVSHPEKKFEIIGKAGRRRLMGWRPTVRGGAMIPPDHPHGGGEGKTPIGMKYAKTPWGKHAFGVKTRKRKKTNKYIIQRRVKKK